MTTESAKLREQARDRADRMRSLARQLRDAVARGLLPADEANALAGRCEQIASRVERTLAQLEELEVV